MFNLEVDFNAVLAPYYSKLNDVLSRFGLITSREGISLIGHLFASWKFLARWFYIFSQTLLVIHEGAYSLNLAQRLLLTVRRSFISHVCKASCCFARLTSPLILKDDPFVSIIYCISVFSPDVDPWGALYFLWSVFLGSFFSCDLTSCSIWLFEKATRCLTLVCYLQIAPWWTHCVSSWSIYLCIASLSTCICGEFKYVSLLEQESTPKYLDASPRNCTPSISQETSS